MGSSKISISVRVLTVSDRSSTGERVDAGGPAVAEAAKLRGWDVLPGEIVPDEVEGISAVLERWSLGDDAVDLILTTGGTGLGPRDVTPEATQGVLDREIPGFVEKIRREGEAKAPMAALSRAVAGTRGRTLILNLPGSPQGAVESLGFVADLIDHAIAMIRGGGH